MAEGVVCRVRIRNKPERIDAAIEMDGTATEVRDARLEDLFRALKEAERLSLLSRGTG